MKKIKQYKSVYVSGFRPVDLKTLNSIQVKPRDDSKEAFEEALRAFKSLVQKEKILSLYKEKQRYEKPSVKKRRKRREAAERKRAMEAKEKLMQSGEWDKRMKKKLAKRAKVRNENNNKE